MRGEEICPSSHIRFCANKQLTFSGVLVAEWRKRKQVHGSILSNGSPRQWTGQSSLSLIFADLSSCNRRHYRCDAAVARVSLSRMINVGFRWARARLIGLTD